MSVNRGKQFEQKFKEDWIKSFPQGWILRFRDHFDGRKGSWNVSDFICYVEGHLFLIETKSIHGNTFNLDFAQKERLKSINVEGVHPLLIVWFVDHDKIVAFPISSIVDMEKNGLKSINIKTYQNYPCIDIPGQKKRVFIDSDYKCLLEYFKEVTNQ